MLPSFVVRSKTQRREEVGVMPVKTALFFIFRNLKFKALRVAVGALCVLAPLRETFFASATKTAGVV
jgi:hypothetical protein